MTNKNTKIIGLFEKNISKVVTFKEFIIPNKVVISKKIVNNIQKSCSIIQAYNDKDNNLILIQLSTKLLDDIPETGNYYFAIYYPNYKKKFKIIKSVYDSCLFYSNKPVDNLT